VVVAKGKVEEWSDTEGWGAISSPDVDGLVWTHFSAIEGDGFRTLRVGELVELDVEGPLGFEQDGFRYRALSVRPLER
jgi:CspA family cold shock protein